LNWAEAVFVAPIKISANSAVQRLYRSNRVIMMNVVLWLFRLYRLEKRFQTEPTK
jgi:hypothetical protein